MTKIYGQTNLDSSPDVVTHCYHQDGSISIGYWQQGKLVLIENILHDQSENLGSDLFASTTIVISDTNQVIVLDSDDYSAEKRDQYFSNIYSDHVKSHSVQIEKTGQTIVCKSQSSENDIDTGSVHHILEGLIKSIEAETPVVYLIVQAQHFILANFDGDKLQHFKILDSSDVNSIGYHTLAFYQNNKIAPNTPLQYSGLSIDQIEGLALYLPYLDSMKVPSSYLIEQVENHTDLIPHYLGYLCVS